MFRRLLAAVLVAAIATPVAAHAGRGCSMTMPMITSERCECCTFSAGPDSDCASAQALRGGCDCQLRADSGSQPAQPSSAGSMPPVSFIIDAALIPAALSTPRWDSRVLPLAKAPPGPGASVSRPLLCSWVI